MKQINVGITPEFLGAVRKVREVFGWSHSKAVYNLALVGLMAYDTNEKEAFLGFISDKKGKLKGEKE